MRQERPHVLAFVDHLQHERGNGAHGRIQPDRVVLGGSARDADRRVAPARCRGDRDTGVRVGRSSVDRSGASQRRNGRRTLPAYRRAPRARHRRRRAATSCGPSFSGARACGGRLRFIATIEDPPVVQRILRHLGLPTAIPAPAPDRACARVRLPRLSARRVFEPVVS